MKGISAKRLKISMGEVWKSPDLHVLITQEDDVIVARCLDFRVSSHGVDADDALNSLAEAIKEYVLTSIENDATDTVFDPANSRYWRMFNELESRASAGKLKRSIKKTIALIPADQLAFDLPGDIFK